MAKRKQKIPTFRRMNITYDLLKSWQSLRRANDSTAIAEFMAKKKAEGHEDYQKTFSVSTINNALAYGFVNTFELREAITAFYLNRQQADRAAAEKLNNTQNVEDLQSTHF